jgi:hypothetical protein
MSPDLAAEYEHLNTRVDGMIDRVAAYSPEVQAAPVGKSYSPLKAVEHMYLVDKDYVKLAEGFDKAKFAGRSGKPTFFYQFILRGMAKPANFAAPTLKKFSPESAVLLEESAKKWREARSKLIAHMGNFGDDEGAIKHPLFGLMSPRDFFILLEKHQDYHDVRLPS